MASTVSQGNNRPIEITAIDPIARPLPAGFLDINTFLSQFDEDVEFNKTMPEARKWVQETYYSREPNSLRSLRLSKGLSQVQLATMIGTQQSRLSRIENGKEEPGLTTLKKLAQALDVDLNTIGNAISLMEEE